MGYIVDSVTIPGPMNNLKKLKLQAETQALQDVATLLETGKYSDVLLVVGEKEYQAHKNILSARSSVFASMLELNVETNKENKEQQKIEIADMKVEVFDEMIKYIYSGRIDSLEKHAADLFVAANKVRSGNSYKLLLTSGCFAFPSLN